MEHLHVLAGTVRVADGERLHAYLDRAATLEVLSVNEAVQREQRLLNASVRLRRSGDSVPGGPIDCELHVRAEQAPNPDSRVVLGDAIDRFGCPRPIVQWRTQKQDWDSVARTARLLATALEERHGVRPALSIGANPARANGPASAAGLDELGTTRMTDDPERGVVDRDCLVHGTSNLYVAGSSVFPSGGCANPMFTIVALAHRLVDHLSAWP